jgi:hypothetical protein
MGHRWRGGRAGRALAGAGLRRFRDSSGRVDPAPQGAAPGASAQRRGPAFPRRRATPHHRPPDRGQPRPPCCGRCRTRWRAPRGGACSSSSQRQVGRRGGAPGGGGGAEARSAARGARCALLAMAAAPRRGRRRRAAGGGAAGRRRAGARPSRCAGAARADAPPPPPPPRAAAACAAGPGCSVAGSVSALAAADEFTCWQGRRWWVAAQQRHAGGRTGGPVAGRRALCAQPAGPPSCAPTQPPITARSRCVPRAHVRTAPPASSPPPPTPRQGDQEAGRLHQEQARLKPKAPRRQDE